MIQIYKFILVAFIHELRKNPGKTLRRTNNTIKILYEAHKRYKSSFIDIGRQAAYLTVNKNYLLDEAYSLGLLDPRIPKGELSKFCSRVTMQKTQRAVSPGFWGMALLENKGIFYKFCTLMNVPIPKLLALFFRESAGWTSEGSVLTNRYDWVSYFNTGLPSEFVIKPTPATHGEGLNIFSRSGLVFIDAFGKSYKPEELYEMLIAYNKWNCFVIQERLTNIAELKRLSDTPYLQTIRITTFVDRYGDCRILYAYLRPIAGSNIFDNHFDGLTGNLIARVSLADGVLHPAIIMTKNDYRSKVVRAHPNTKVTFEGFQLPLWKETCELIRETALKFLPIRTIGWDVALTPNGIFIVEGNFRYAPPNSIKFSDKLLETLSSGLHQYSKSSSFLGGVKNRSLIDTNNW